ncbi:hypothetical protein DFS33DRAFT_1087248 [Desarmillaria ectypa]|nr:hypothetical protein DFS33DRAFT_1087248 [Desarmillaria ectypa]
MLRIPISLLSPPQPMSFPLFSVSFLYLSIEMFFTTSQSLPFHRPVHSTLCIVFKPMGHLSSCNHVESREEMKMDVLFDNITPQFCPKDTGRGRLLPRHLIYSTWRQANQCLHVYSNSSQEMAVRFCGSRVQYAANAYRYIQ